MDKTSKYYTPNLAQKLHADINRDTGFNMKEWHAIYQEPWNILEQGYGSATGPLPADYEKHFCNTTHCIAGWAIVHNIAATLEGEHPAYAAVRVLKASIPDYEEFSRAFLFGKLNAPAILSTEPKNCLNDGDWSYCYSHELYFDDSAFRQTNDIATQELEEFIFYTNESLAKKWATALVQWVKDHDVKND